MPTDKNKLLRYKVLDNCFRDTSRLYRIDDLVERCNHELARLDLRPVSRRTVQLDLQTLQAEPYNVEFDPELQRSRCYRYADLGFVLSVLTLTTTSRDALRQTIDLLRERCSDPDEQHPQWQWMLASLEAIAADRPMEAGAYVSFENNASFAGNVHFAALLEAVVGHHPVVVRYRPYQSTESTELKVHPYHLKQYNSRWFLFCAQEGVEGLTNLALDRILSVRPWRHAFRETDTNFQHYFDDMVGVSVNTSMATEQIVLRVRNVRYPYVETKPFSEKQRIVSHDNLCHTIAFPLKVNNEFVAQLLSFGADIEVLQPQHLRQRLASAAEQMHRQYSNAQKDCTSQQ